MPRIQPTDWKTQVRIFELYGCKYKSKKGSHHILICPGARRAVVIPEYDEVDVEIIRNNMRTAGMSWETYFGKKSRGVKFYFWLTIEAQRAQSKLFFLPDPARGGTIGQKNAALRAVCLQSTAVCKEEVY